MNHFRKRLITVALGLIVAVPSCCPGQAAEDDEQAVAALRKLGVDVSPYYSPYTGFYLYRHPDVVRVRQSLSRSERTLTAACSRSVFSLAAYLARPA
jgi:hypothetical protein